MRHAGADAPRTGVRTAFNLLGPLTNPAGARRQLVGVSRPEHTELVARTLGLLGAERAWVVHGAGGLDEISTTRPHEGLRAARRNGEHVLCAPGRRRPCREQRQALAGGTAAENAAAIESLLDGETGPRRDVVLLNAAAALLVAGRAASLGDGVAARRESLVERARAGCARPIAELVRK